jgi:hypothetical protein
LLATTVHHENPLTVLATRWRQGAGLFIAWNPPGIVSNVDDVISVVEEVKAIELGFVFAQIDSSDCFGGTSRVFDHANHPSTRIEPNTARLVLLDRCHLSQPKAGSHIPSQSPDPMVGQPTSDTRNHGRSEDGYDGEGDHELHHSHTLFAPQMIDHGAPLHIRKTQGSKLYTKKKSLTQTLISRIYI